MVHYVYDDMIKFLANANNGELRDFFMNLKKEIDINRYKNINSVIDSTLVYIESPNLSNSQEKLLRNKPFAFYLIENAEKLLTPKNLKKVQEDAKGVQNFALGLDDKQELKEIAYELLLGLRLQNESNKKTILKVFNFLFQIKNMLVKYKVISDNFFYDSKSEQGIFNSIIERMSKEDALLILSERTFSKGYYSHKLKKITLNEFLTECDYTIKYKYEKQPESIEIAQASDEKNAVTVKASNELELWATNKEKACKKIISKIYLAIKELDENKDYCYLCEKNLNINSRYTCKYCKRLIEIVALSMGNPKEIGHIRQNVTRQDSMTKKRDLFVSHLERVKSHSESQYEEYLQLLNTTYPEKK